MHSSTITDQVVVRIVATVRTVDEEDTLIHDTIRGGSTISQHTSAHTSVVVALTAHLTSF